MKTSPILFTVFSFVFAATAFFSFSVPGALAACDWVATGHVGSTMCADAEVAPAGTPGQTTTGHFSWGGWCNTTYTYSCSAPTCSSPQVWDGTSCVSPISLTCNVNGTSSDITLSTSNPVTYNYSISGSATACFEYGSGSSQSFSSGAHSISYGTLPAGNYTRGVSCGNAAGPVDCFVGVHAYSLTVPGSCVIAANAATCTVTASWTVPNPVGTTRFLVDGNNNNNLSNSASGSGTVWVAYGGTTFKLMNSNGSVLLTTSDPVSGTCIAGTTWNGSVCSYPDLTVTTNAASPTSAAPNTSVSLSGTVRNNGPGTASNFPNSFQIADSALTTTLARVNAGTVSSLASNATANLSGAYTFTTSGSYKVRLCTNYDTSGNLGIPESVDTNNCGTWVDITIAPAAVPTVNIQFQ